MESNIIKILAIDDNHDNLVSLNAMITDLFPNAKVFTALNGKRGIEIAIEENPDIVLLDVVMPEIDGFEVCKRMKSDRYLCDIPVVFVTANKEEKESRIRALESGAEAFLAKPIDESELTAQILAMSKIRMANKANRKEKENLSTLVKAQMHELKATHDATLNLLEDFKNENEQRKKTEIQLRESEEKYRFMFANNPQPMWIYDLATLRFLEINNAAVQHYGYSRQEFLAMTLIDIRPAEDHALLLKDVELTTDAYNRGGEWRHLKKSGELIFVEIVSHLITFNGVKARHVMINDITDRKNSEMQLHKLSQAVEQSPVSIILTDTKGNIDYANPKTLEITGYSWTELVGKNPKIFSSGEKPKQEYIDLWKTISSGREWRGEFHNKKKNGELFWELALVSPIINENGIITNYLAIKEDITERKQIVEDLMIAKQKAEENDQLKTAFLSNMSHEIRTPMNAVLGFSQLLSTQNISENEKLLFSEYININGASLLKIIDDIIDISKIQSKQLTIRRKDFDLHKLLQELEMFYSNQSIKKINNDLELHVQLLYNKEEPFIIHTDEIRLKQILNNLISNAIKYTEKGRIIFGYDLHDNKLQLFVKDTGIGIPTKEQEYIFDRFVQYSKKYIARQEGTGLGLAISKELVFLLGGELKVDSVEDKGSKFYFDLPLLNVENKKVETKSNGNDLIISDLSNYTVLIADDEESNYILTKRMLHKTQVKTEWAINGKKAIEMITQKKYDLVLMDIKMPDMDGIEATRLIKQKHNIPIIIQTAFAMPHVKDEALKAGCNDFIVKPILFDDLLALMVKQLTKPSNK